MFGLGRPAAGDPSQLVGQAIDDLRTRHDLGQRPGQRQGGRVVARDQDRDERVAHLPIIERRAVLVRCREQVVEHVLTAGSVIAPPPHRDEREQVVVEVAQLPEQRDPPRPAQPVDRDDRHEHQGVSLPAVGEESSRSCARSGPSPGPGPGPAPCGG